MKHLIFTILLLFSLPLQAAGFYLHGTSYHTGKDHILNLEHYNQTNPGISLYFGMTDNTKLELGIYKNSFFRQSQYAAVTHRLYNNKYGEVGLMYGVVHGYPVTIPVLPLVMPYVEVQRLRIVLMPDYTQLILGFSLRLM